MFTVRVRLELAQVLLIEPQVRQTAIGGEQGDALRKIFFAQIQMFPVAMLFRELMYFPISETGPRLLAPFSRAASARRAFGSSVTIPPFSAELTSANPV